VRIGSGNSSIVFIRFDTQNERYVAIKQFKKEFLSVYFNKIDLVREISTMKKIKEDGNNNFVRLYDAVKIIK
jgi:serine/threonine protein kinase